MESLQNRQTNSKFQPIFYAKFWFYLAVFLLPLERVLVLKLGDTSVRFTHLFLLIAILLWLYRKSIEWIENKSYKQLFKEYDKKFYKITVLYKLIVIYFVVLGFGLIFAQDFQRSCKVFLYTVFILGIIFFIPQFFHRIKEITFTIKIFLFSSLLTCLFGIYQFIADMAGLGLNWTFLTERYTKSILGFTRIQAFFVEPLYFANFLIFPIIFCILLLMKGVKKVKTKIFLWLTLFFCIINFVLANARGAFIALFFVLLLMFAFNHKKFSKEFYYSIITVIVLIAVMGSIFYFTAPQSLGGKFVYHAIHPFQGAAFDERRETFSSAWQMFKEHKIIGNGPGSFGVLAPLKEWEVRENWKIVNNLYLELLAENGILGFMVMMVFFILLIWYLYKAYKTTSNKLLKVLLQGFILVILGILIQYNTFSIIYLPYVWIVMGLGVALLKQARQ